MFQLKLAVLVALVALVSAKSILPDVEDGVKASVGPIDVDALDEESIASAEVGPVKAEVGGDEAADVNVERKRRDLVDADKNGVEANVGDDVKANVDKDGVDANVDDVVKADADKDGVNADVKNVVDADI